MVPAQISLETCWAGSKTRIFPQRWTGVEGTLLNSKGNGCHFWPPQMWRLGCRRRPRPSVGRTRPALLGPWFLSRIIMRIRIEHPKKQESLHPLFGKKILLVQYLLSCHPPHNEDFHKQNCVALSAKLRRYWIHIGPFALRNREEDKDGKMIGVWNDQWGR